MNQTLEGGLRPVESAFDFVKEQVATYHQTKLKKKSYQKQLVKRFFTASTAALLVIAVNTPQMKAAAETTQSAEAATNQAFDSSLKLDNSQYSLLVIEQNNTQITPGKSLAEEQAEAAARKAAQEAAARAAAQARLAQTTSPDYSAPRQTSSLSTDVAHQMAQQAAAQAGIGNYWKILAAIWQVETGKSGDTCVVSGADGQAMGPMQFMPGTFRSHATSPNASICKASDALAAAANLLRDAGLADGNVQSAIYSYNHSQAYVNTVMQIADSIQS